MNLEPVRDALLADARRDAAAVRAAAERDADAAVEAARDRAERLVGTARAEGEAEARAVSASELARARRRARELVLAARREAYERVQAELRRAASDLRHDPGYAALVAGLGDLARGQLGDAAAVSVDERAGGVVARAGTRSVDYRLPVVAERCLEALGPELEALWR